MNDAQKAFVEELSERVAIMFEGKDNARLAIGLIYIDAIRTKHKDGTCSWDIERIKSLVSSMKEYGGLDEDIDCIRDAWRTWMVKQPSDNSSQASE